MRICLMIEGQEGVTWEQWLALADAAERAGLEALFRSDHYLSTVGGNRQPGALDAWTTIAALAARTERLRLGTLVSPVTFRHPAVLAKSVVTADHVSRGRVELGIGAGWMEAEHEAFDFPFGTARDRIGELHRQIEIVHRHWTDDENAWPKPVQQPHPPLIVGGTAKPGTARACARWGDEYNTTGASPEVCRERRRAVEDAWREAGREEPLRFSLMTMCIVGRDGDEVRDRAARVGEAIGRGPDFVERVLEAEHTITGTVDEVGERLRDYERAGVDRVMLQHLAHEDVEMVALLGELV